MTFNVDKFTKDVLLKKFRSGDVFKKIKSISFKEAHLYIALRDSYMCQLCGQDVWEDYMERQEYYHLDHIIPKSRFGHSYPSNLQLTCAPCNMKKGTWREDDEFKLRLAASERTEKYFPPNITHAIYLVLRQHYKDKSSHAMELLLESYFSQIGIKDRQEIKNNIKEKKDIIISNKTFNSKADKIIQKIISYDSKVLLSQFNEVKNAPLKRVNDYSFISEVLKIKTKTIDDYSKEMKIMLNEFEIKYRTLFGFSLKQIFEFCK